MEKLVVATHEELEALIESSVRRALKTDNTLKNQNPAEHLTAAQAAEFLNLAKQKVYGLTSKNEIPHYKRGKKLYFLKAELQRWLLEGKQPVKQQPKVYIKNRS